MQVLGRRGLSLIGQNVFLAWFGQFCKSERDNLNHKVKLLFEKQSSLMKPKTKVFWPSLKYDYHQALLNLIQHLKFSFTAIRIFKDS